MPIYFSDRLDYYCENCNIDLDDQDKVCEHLKELPDHKIIVKEN